MRVTAVLTLYKVIRSKKDDTRTTFGMIPGTK